MKRSELSSGDLIILRDLPESWSDHHPHEYGGLLLERFNIYPDSSNPSWAWRVMWYTPEPRFYNDRHGVGEINLINFLHYRSSTYQKPSRELT